VDAMANSWTANLGIDGYTEDCSANYPCMAQTPSGGLDAWAAIVRRVRKLQPQLVHSGEGYSSWAQMIEADANLGGQGFTSYHSAMQKAVFDGDASDLEDVASTSGADASSVVCYLHPAFDGKQPGGCPTMYFRDTSATIKNVKQHQLWVALEAGSGIVSQHDYDPESSCAGWAGCEFWSHGQPGAWWNVTNDPIDASVDESPLWAFSQHRALNRLALRTKLTITNVSAVPDASRAGAAPGAMPANYTVYDHANAYDGFGGHAIDGDGVTGVTVAQCAKRCDDDPKCDCVTYFEDDSSRQCWKRSQCVPAQFERDTAMQPYSVYVKKDGPKPPPTRDGGALAYLKHDALGPAGDAAILVYNPGVAQRVTIDLSALPATLLSGRVTPTELLQPGGAQGPPLAKAWTVEMAAGEARAFGGFSLASFAPRLGKKDACKADDGYSRVAAGTTLEACFLECLADTKCSNVHVPYVDIVWMEKPPPVTCTLLGLLQEPSASCSEGTGTLIKKLPKGRPRGAGM